ncbi:hypothetical protein Q3G72_031801 [Acer saccharum]|nr:hypothetical protein Q3G72_031801 [Acer saccharum]
MALTDAFEPTRASLLHRHPLPTLDHAVSELISEETRLATLQTQRTDTVLATHSHQSSHQRLFCKYCRQSGHLILQCPIRRCKHCQKVRLGHFNDTCPTNPDKKGSSTKPKVAFFKNSNGNQQFSAATTDDTRGTVASDSPSSSFSIHDLESMLQQILSKSGNPSISASSISSDITIPLFPDDIDPSTSFKAQIGASDNILPTPELSDLSADLVLESSHSSPPLIHRSNRDLHQCPED